MLIQTHSETLPDRSLKKINEVVNHEGFSLILQFLKEQAVIKAAEAINDIPDSPDHDGLIQSALFNKSESKAFKGAFEILKRIQDNEIEITKTEVKI